MKLPYKRGDSFALPLGNGEFAESCIAECEHRVVVVSIPVGDDAPLALRVSDDALVAHRWKRMGRSESEPVHAQNRHWISAARAERLAAAALGAPHPRARHLNVREIRNENAVRSLTAIDDDTMLALTETLKAPALEALLAALHDHPGAAVRVHGRAMDHLAALSGTPVRSLTLAQRPSTLPAFPSVRRLALIGAMTYGDLPSLFPNVTALTIDANGSAIDVRALQALGALRSLDLSSGSITDAGAFSRLQGLRALRISRVTGVREPSPLVELPLATLALEHLHELASVAALRTISTLEQLELLGMWQFDVAGVEWTLEMRKLVRAEIDIGGRRKNVELYRRAAWAYPWPFASTRPA